MAVSESTQTFILSVVDANQEFNTKLILFTILFAYSIFMIWLSNKIYPFFASEDVKDKIPLHLKWSGLLMRLTSIVMLIFFPLIVGVMMYRTLALDFVLTQLIIFYRVTFALSLGIFFLFGMNWTLKFLEKAGINFKDTKGTIIRRRNQ